MTKEKNVTTRQYIIEWLEESGFYAKKWDRESEDGHWLMYCLTEADGSNCLCCWEAQYERVKELLQTTCEWQALHFEALLWLEQKQEGDDENP